MSGDEHLQTLVKEALERRNERATLRGVVEMMVYEQGLGSDGQDEDELVGRVLKRCRQKLDMNDEALSDWARENLPTVKGAQNPLRDCRAAFVLLRAARTASISLGKGISGTVACQITPGSSLEDLPQIPYQDSRFTGTRSLEGQANSQGSLSRVITRAFYDTYRLIEKYDKNVTIFDREVIEPPTIKPDKELDDELRSTLQAGERKGYELPEFEDISGDINRLTELLDDPLIGSWWMFRETLPDEDEEWIALPSIYPAEIGGDGGEAQGRGRATSPERAITRGLLEAWEKARLIVRDGQKAPTMTLHEGQVEIDGQECDLTVLGPANGMQRNELIGRARTESQEVEVSIALLHPTRWGIDSEDENRLFEALRSELSS